MIYLIVNGEAIPADCENSMEVVNRLKKSRFHYRDEEIDEEYWQVSNRELDAVCMVNPQQYEPLKAEVSLTIDFNSGIDGISDWKGFINRYYEIGLMDDSKDNYYIDLIPKLKEYIYSNSLVMHRKYLDELDIELNIFKSIGMSLCIEVDRKI